MAKTIQQTVEFSGVSPETLFDIYLDSKKHSALIGFKASVSRKAGGKFMAYDGDLTGRNIVIVPNRLIVQSCRAKGWKKTDPDSILILSFSKTRKGARINLVHANVPDHDYQGVNQGWRKYYWIPWKAYLKGKFGDK